MQSTLESIIRSLSKINFPSIGIIDILEIILISFFRISVHGMDQVYPCIYPP
jgi:hypothetical protein